MIILETVLRFIWVVLFLLLVRSIVKMVVGGER